MLNNKYFKCPETLYIENTYLLANQRLNATGRDNPQLKLLENSKTLSNLRAVKSTHQKLLN